MSAKRRRISKQSVPDCQVLQIKFPLSLLENLKSTANGESYLRFGRTDEGKQINILGKCIDRKYFSLLVRDETGFTTANGTISCNIEDTYFPQREINPIKDGTHAPSTSNLEQQTFSLECHSASQQPTTVFQDELANTGVAQRKSSRLTEKYGQNYSVVKCTSQQFDAKSLSRNTQLISSFTDVSPGEICSVQQDGLETAETINLRVDDKASDPVCPKSPSQYFANPECDSVDSAECKTEVETLKMKYEPGGSTTHDFAEPSSTAETVASENVFADSCDNQVDGVDAIDDLDQETDDDSEDLFEGATNFFECYICDYLTGEGSELDSHFKIFHGNLLSKADTSEADKDSDDEVATQAFPCKVCDAKFKALGSLTRHLKKKHKDNAKGTAQLTAILEHRWSKFTSGTEQSCPFCEKTYFGHCILSHLRHCHSKEPNYKDFHQTALKMLSKDKYQRSQDEHLAVTSCPYCGKEIKKCSLRRHVENACTANNAVKRRYCCHMCTFYSYDLAECQRHKASEHKEEQREYICEVCAKTFTNLSGLTLHKRHKHNLFKRKPLDIRTCPECGKTFVRKSSFERHLLTHDKYNTGRQHACETCGKAYKDKSGLLSHVRTIHEGQYPFKCETCGHGFRRQAMKDGHQCGRTRRKTPPDTAADLCQLPLPTVGGNDGGEEGGEEVLQVQVADAMETADVIPNNQIGDMVIVQAGADGNFLLSNGVESMYVVLNDGNEGLDAIQGAQSLDELVNVTGGFDDVEQASMFNVVETNNIATFQE